MTDNHPVLLFFVGKGGVGKSTFSALTALHKSQLPLNTLLVSMDPAHNQEDIFHKKIGEKPCRIEDHLQVIQVDTDRQIKSYLHATEENIRKRYTYHTAFSMKDHFKAFQYSPGIEEYAMLQAFGSILSSNHDKDVIIFDMPPTAMTLRFFSLPGITLSWIHELIELREKIFKKQQIISRIRFGKKNIETDPVLGKLKKMKRQYEKFNQLFQTSSFKIILVTKPDDLSLSESRRIHQKLRELELSIDKVVFNGSTEATQLEDLKKQIPAGCHIGMPEYKGSLTGTSILKDYLSTHTDRFKEL